MEAKFLVDTGSTKTLIKPTLAQNYYKNYIEETPFVINTAHQQSLHKHSITIPVWDLFNVEGEQKFHLFDFNPKYDGLIGIDFLQKLQAKIDLIKNELITPYATIPLKNLQDETPCIKKKYEYTIPSRCEKIIKIPTDTDTDNGYINHMQFENGLEIPSCIVTSQNYECFTTILNTSCQDVDITFKEPLKLLEIEENIEINHREELCQPSTYYDKLLKENLKNLRLDHTNKEEYDAIRKLCYEFRDIFHCKDIPLGYTGEIKHVIRTTDDKPIYTKSYRLPPIHNEEVKNQINNMLEQNIIRESISPWSSPIWVVPKKLDASNIRKWRLVIDYRRLNEKTVEDKFPIPNIEDILDKLGRANYFTTLDLASGFHQILVDENSVEKTAFSTPQGHFEFLRMPFGLRNSPSTFQRTMNHILRGLTEQQCMVYLDDIIIFSTSLQEHLGRLKNVFQRLRAANLKVQLDKSEFLRTEVNYLGHIITPQGIRPNNEKIRVIENYPIPCTTKEIKAFLGLLGYYRKFIRNFASLTKPLTRCLKKGANIEHNEDFITAFNKCKKILCHDPILQFPDFSKEFNLTTDASNIALGSVLSQGCPPNDKPVAYASRTLSDTETKYSTVERELLCLLWACKHFRPYLFGRRFKIYTDHRPLTWLFSLKDPSSKLARWKIKLQEFDFEVIYKKGSQNVVADALSRITAHPMTIQGTSKETDNASIVPQVDDIDFENALRDLTDNPNIEPNNEVINEIIQDLENIDQADTNPNDEQSDTLTQTAHTNANDEPTKSIEIIESIVNSKPNQIIVNTGFGNRIRTKRSRVEGKDYVETQIPKDDNYDIILNFLKEYTTGKKTYHMWFDQDKMYQDFTKVYVDNFADGGPKLIRCTKKVVNVPMEDRLQAIRNYHESKTNHRGISETLKRIKEKYYWLNLQNDVTRYINNCEKCRSNKYERHTPAIKDLLTETFLKPFENLHIDTFIIDGNSYLTIIDSFSKLGQAYKILGKNGTEIAEKIMEFIKHYGAPTQITYDGGPEFSNAVVKELLEAHKIKLHITTPRHHESNALIERLHSTLLEHYRLLEGPADERMQQAIIAYNNTIHSSTNLTPLEIVLGHTATRNPFDMLYTKEYYQDLVNKHVKAMEEVYNKLHDKLRQEKTKRTEKQSKEDTSFKIGDTIYTRTYNRNKKVRRFIGPWKIIKLLEHNKCQIEHLKTNKKKTVHLADISRPVAGSPPSPST